MEIAKKIENLADATEGNFKVSFVKVVLGSTAGFLATVATQKLVSAIVKSNPSTPGTPSK